MVALPSSPSCEACSQLKGKTVSDVFKERPLSSFYKGLGPVLQACGISNFIYFYIWVLAKALRQRMRAGDALTPIDNLAASTIAGAINMSLTEPLWKASSMLRTGMSDAKGITAALKQMAAKDGVLSLWSGLPVSLWLVSNPIIVYYSYDSIKERFLGGRYTLEYPWSTREYHGCSSASTEPRTSTHPMCLAAVKRKSLSGVEAFVLGAVAKAIATVVTYPLQIAQTRLRAQKASEDGSARSVPIDMYGERMAHRTARAVKS